MKRLRQSICLALLCGLWACTPAAPVPTPSPIPPSATPFLLPTFFHIPGPPTATPLTCLNQPPDVESGELDSSRPPQLFLVYLPPCYAANPLQHYPVLYLLHGQTYIEDQWVRLGAPLAANQLILAGQTPPFIMVFPDDRYWNLPEGPGFGDRLVNMVMPYVDAHYRTLADRQHRAVGGLSRGGGWAVHFLLHDDSLFGTVGLHSPAIFDTDGPYLDDLVRAIPSGSWPRLWIDAGDQDRELGSIQSFEGILSVDRIPHEWHLYTGDHSEAYWSAHVTEYLLWYTADWSAAAAPLQTLTPQP